MGSLESDTTEQLHFPFSLSCIGEGNGNPLQCSCLENPRDGEAWWAAIYGVAQSWTLLMRLSSSSSNKVCGFLAPQSKIASPTLEGKVLTTGLLGMSQQLSSIWYSNLCFFFFNFILFFNFTILYWFCHISKWIRHRYTCVLSNSGVEDSWESLGLQGDPTSPS